MGGPTKRTAGPVIQDEEAFPRGGGSGLAPIAHKKLRQVGAAFLYYKSPDLSSFRIYFGLHVRFQYASVSIFG